MMMAKVVSKLLAARAEDVARYLLPNGKRKGQEWCVGNVAGEPGESLRVHLSGNKAGIWSDFSTGEGGDLLDLWCKRRNFEISKAIQEATHYLGISAPQFVAYKPLKFVKPGLKDATNPLEQSSVMQYLLNDRKMNKSTIAAFGIKERNGQIVFPYQRDGECIFAKYLSLERPNGKKQMHVDGNCEPCLFGWHQIPPTSRTLIICEGELDAMSFFQYGLPALSVPFGGGSGDKQKWVEFEFDRLTLFDTIYLCFDDDEEGKAATAELISRLGRHRCRVVALPYKDANECLQKGVSQEDVRLCIDNARTVDPDELKSASLFAEQVINEFYPPPGAFLGYEAPWIKTKGKVLFRPDELSIWTGINGHGKSQFLGYVLLHMMKQGARVCIASLELKPQRLLHRMTRQASAIAEPAPDYIRAIHDWYGDKLWLFDLVGNAKSERLLEVFLYARQRYDVDVFVIDSFMKLDIAEEDYKAQKALVEKLCDFKNQYNCQIHMIVHPRKPPNEDMPPSKLDSKGTGAVSDLADNCFTIWRNKRKEHIKQLNDKGAELKKAELKILEQSDCLWCCDKQRNGEWEGRLGFWFHPASLQYLGANTEKPKRIVEYSNPVKSSATVEMDFQVQSMGG